MSGYLVYEGDCPRCGERLGEPDDDGTRWCVCGIGVAAAWWGFESIDGEEWRYSTEEAALKGHHVVVQLVLAAYAPGAVAE